MRLNVRRSSANTFFHRCSIEIAQCNKMPGIVSYRCRDYIHFACEETFYAGINPVFFSGVRPKFLIKTLKRHLLCVEDVVFFLAILSISRSHSHSHAQFLPFPPTYSLNCDYLMCVFCSILSYSCTKCCHSLSIQCLLRLPSLSFYLCV